MVSEFTGGEAGTGPWSDEYFADKPMVMTGTIYLHLDFDLAGGQKHTHANSKTCSSAVQTLAFSENVRTVNVACGTSGDLDAWDADVRAHEHGHEASLNKCLTTGSPTRKLLENQEKLIYNEARKVSDEAWDLWKDFANNHLQDAAESKLQAGATTTFWHYRNPLGPDGWVLKSYPTGAHNGTDGC